MAEASRPRAASPVPFIDRGALNELGRAPVEAPMGVTSSFRFSLVAAALLLACTTTTITSLPSGPAPTQTNLPEISADKLGGACSGFGTSPGDTAAFTTDTCPGEVCLVDTREGLELYCSADCSKVSCPAGYLCGDVDHGVQRACFKDPNAPPPEDGGKVDAEPQSPFDLKLPGYLAGASTQGSVAISDFKDPTAASRDLIVLVITGRWEPNTNHLLEDLDGTTLSRTALVFVVSEGAQSSVGATAADLSAWHTAHAKQIMVLDPLLAKLGPALGTFEALPSFVAYDARTLKEVGRDLGYPGLTEFKATLDKWRAAAKK